MKIIEETKNNFTEKRVVYNFIQTGARINDALPTTLDHNEGTTGKQGGQAGEFFHTTEDISNGLSVSNAMSATNAAATLIDLFMRGVVNTIIITGAGSATLFLKNNEIFRLFESLGTAAALTTYTFSTTSLNVGDCFMIDVDLALTEGKKVRFLLNPSQFIYLSAGDGIILQWMGGTSFRKLAFAPGADSVNAVVFADRPSADNPAAMANLLKTKVISGAHTLTAADAGYFIDVDATITMPQDSTENLPDDFKVFISDVAAGDISVANEGGDTFQAPGTSISTFTGGIIHKRGSGDWVGRGAFK